MTIKQIKYVGIICLIKTHYLECLLTIKSFVSKITFFVTMAYVKMI